MPNKTPARSNVIALQQILKLIPLGLITRHARETGVADKSRSFSVVSHLAAMLFAQLSHAMGLNDVCDWLRLKTKALARIGVTPPSKNGLSHANKERSADFAEKLFWSVLGHLQNASPSFAAGRKGKSDRMRELQPGNSGFADLIIALHELSRNPNHVDAGKTSKACSATARCPMQRTSKHPP